MKLLTKEIIKKLPKLYSTEAVPMDEKIVYVKFFNPCGIGTWYALEYDEDEKLFFGYVDLIEKEFGYFSLEELESIKLPFGLGIERDLYFNPTPLKEVLKNIS